MLTRVLPLTAALLVAGPAPAEDRERRVRVALAMTAAAQCGECRFDEPACRAESARTGKPLVLFVGGSCEKCGAAVKEAGGIPCVVSSYAGDGKADARRAVVLTPKPSGDFWLGPTVPLETASVKTAVSSAAQRQPPGKKLDWDFSPATGQR